MTAPWFLCGHCEGLMVIETIDDDGDATSRCERCAEPYDWNLDDMIPEGKAPATFIDPIPAGAEDSETLLD